jgi:hypothetical protein
MLDIKLPKIISATRIIARVERGQSRRHVYFMPELRRAPQPGGGSTRHQLIDDDLSDQEPDHLKPFTGVMVAVALSIPIWIIITGLLFYLI